MSSISTVSGGAVPNGAVLGGTPPPPPPAQRKDRDGDEDNNRPDAAAKAPTPQLGNNVNMRI